MPGRSISFQERNAVIVIGILLRREHELLEVVCAADCFRAVAGAVEGRQQHARQNRNDRYYNEQLNKGEIVFFRTYRRFHNGMFLSDFLQKSLEFTDKLFRQQYYTMGLLVQQAQFS